jgi:hypothetical protein
MDPNRYRKTASGTARHDGDCWFWNIKICTCGLLHDMEVKTDPEKYYPDFYEEKVTQHETVRLLKVRVEALEEIRNTCDQCAKTANKAIKDKSEITPNELCQILHEVGFEADFWLVSSLSKKQLEEAHNWACWERLDQWGSIPGESVAMPNFLVSSK